MSPRVYIAVAVGLLVSAMPPLSGGDLPAGTDKAITLREVATPLYKIAERLSSSQVRLTVGPELRETKAIVIIREQPLAEVMSRLAQVFGARWVPVSDATPATHQLRRTDEVSRWVSRWKASRVEAARMARERSAARTRMYMNGLIQKALQTPTRTEDPNADPPPGVASVALTRFLGTLSAADRDALARSVADGSELHTGGEFREVPGPRVYRFTELSGVQKKALVTWIQEAFSGDPLRTVTSQLNDANVAFRIQGYIRLDLRLPDGSRHGDYAMAFKVRSDEGEEFFHEALLHLLSRHPTPPQALLGASFTAERTTDPVSGLPRSVGKAKPALRMVDADRPVEIPPVYAPGRLYRGFLSLIEDRAGLNLISDCYTLSHRVASGKEIPPQPRLGLRDLLASVTDRFQVVFRQEGGFLLARNYFWPDRDEEEVPHPLPEPWLDTKRDKGSLPLEDLIRMARLSEPQQNGLCAYDDKVVSFRKEVEYLRGNRRAMAALSTLSKTQLAEMRGKTGLPLRAINPQVRALLYQEFLSDAGGSRPDGTVPEEWQRAVLWLRQLGSGSQPVRQTLYALLPPGQPFWESQLPFARGSAGAK